MIAPPTSPPYASRPFDDRKGDLIIRSSDHVDFRIPAVILYFASPFFASMLEIGQTRSNESERAQPDGDEIRDGCRVVPVSEDSDTLDPLLRIIFPQEDPTLDDLPTVSVVLAAALKYDMVKATTLAKAKLRSFVPQEPLRVWAIAIRNRFEDDARLAADEVCRQAITALDVFPPEMQDIQAGPYYRLLRYQRLRGVVEGGFAFCDRTSFALVSPWCSHNSPSPWYSRNSPSPYSSTGSIIRQDIMESLRDICCLSSDGHKVFSYKILLILASPVLARSIEILSTAGVEADDSHQADESSTEPRLPTLPLSEDGATLEILIDLCQPCQPESDSASQSDMFMRPKIRNALQKYQMNRALETLRDQWSRRMTVDPLRAYLVAATQQNVEEARRAARLLLKRPMEHYYTQLLEDASAAHYRRALLVHRACRNSASELAALCRAVATSESQSSDFPPVPRKSKTCSNSTGYYSSSCGGSVYVVRNPDRPQNVCGHCATFAKPIINFINSLTSGSDLLSTLDMLKGSSSEHATSYLELLSSAEDRSAIQALYTALQKKLAAQVDEVRHV